MAVEDRSNIQATGVAGLRAAVADVPDDAEVVAFDERGGVYRLREVAGGTSPDGVLLVLTLVKVGHDPSLDGWTGVADLDTRSGEGGSPMDRYIAFGEMENPVPGPEEAGS